MTTITPKIFIQNNLTKQKEEFKPIQSGNVKMYACGITVYDHCHLGHALQAVYFDMIRNYFEFVGYNVTYVRNYTDVDDKIIAKAQSLDKKPQELAEEIIISSSEDMKALHIREPNFAPKVSQSIPSIITMIEDIIRTGHAYANGKGDVYYRVRSKADYGKLSNRNIESLLSGTRELAEGEKEFPLDFALWKKDETPGASWQSPWGLGRPGWHIECSAMSKDCLGSSFDIHGGGRDLIFPHHENEIAQSESANHCSYANYWIHCGLLTIDKQKMSKSLGNHILIKDFLKNWPAEVLRLSFLQHHYSSNIDFNLDIFKHNRSRLFYYYQSFLSVENYLQKFDLPSLSKDLSLENSVVEDFKKSMNDDFNTASAIANLNGHFKNINQMLKGKVSEANAIKIRSLYEGLQKVFRVLGLLQENPTNFINLLKSNFLETQNLSESWMQTKIEERNLARSNKDFSLADKIRNELSELGIELMDLGQKTDWIIKDEKI